MYVRDELGGFPKCACSLLLSVSIFSPIGGGDQRALVTASLRLCPYYYSPSIDLYSLFFVSERSESRGWCAGLGLFGGGGTVLSPSLLR